MYLVFFTLIGECTLMDLGLLDIKLIIRIVIEEVKKYNVLYEYLSEQLNKKVHIFAPKFETTKIKKHYESIKNKKSDVSVSYDVIHGVCHDSKF